MIRLNRERLLYIVNPFASGLETGRIDSRTVENRLRKYFCSQNMSCSSPVQQLGVTTTLTSARDEPVVFRLSPHAELRSPGVRHTGALHVTATFHSKISVYYFVLSHLLHNLRRCVEIRTRLTVLLCLSIPGRIGLILSKKHLLSENR